MGNVTAGGVNDGEDDENEYYEVLFYVFRLYVDATSYGIQVTSDLDEMHRLKKSYRKIDYDILRIDRTNLI